MESTSAANPTVLPASRDRRPWLILGSFIVGTLVALVWLIAFHDDPPPDDAHLMPQRSERGGNTNPLAVYCITMERSGIVRDFYQLSNEARTGEPAAMEEARTFLLAHQAELAAFQALMATDASTWQWPDLATPSRHQAAVVDRYSLYGVVSILTLQAHNAAQHGDMKEGLALAERLVRFSQCLHHAEGNLQELAFAALVRAMAEEQALMILSHGEATPEMIRTCLQNRLDQPEPDARHLHLAMKAEYAEVKQALSTITKKDIAESMGFPKKARSVLPYFYKPNRTLALEARLTTARMEAASQGWRTLHLVEQAHARSLEPHLNVRITPGTFLNPNFAGMHLLAVGQAERPISLAGTDTLTIYAMYPQQVIITLALRLHELEKGTLPARLEELVPA